jgi:small multidrug resistance family-3 protein
LAPVEFSRVVGLYIAILFVVWQLINFVASRTMPALSVMIGGALIVAGGALVTFWRAG